jgi:hypothetical protein
VKPTYKYPTEMDWEQEEEKKISEINWEQKEEENQLKSIGNRKMKEIRKKIEIAQQEKRYLNKS